MIRLNNVSKKFNQKLILNNINYEFIENTIYSIVAPNGMGKTTLLNILSGLMKSDQGKVELSDDIKANDFSVILSGDRNLYAKNTVDENIYYFSIIKGLTKNNIQKRISEYSNLLPIYKEIRKKLVEELSYGQKRLISLFSALIEDSKVIIIDEATEGLDMQHKNLLLNMLSTIKKEKIILLVSHDYDFTTEVSDKILLLDNGTILTCKENISSTELVQMYKKLYNVN